MGGDGVPAGTGARIGSSAQARRTARSALRAVHPNLDSVVFVPHWSAAYRDFELFYGRVDGNVVDVGRGPEANRRLVEMLIKDGCGEDARVEIEAAITTYPDDPRLMALQAGLRSELR